MIYGSINDNGTWRTRYSIEIFTFHDEPDIVKVIKIGRFLWLGHFFRMQELGPCLDFLNQKALDV